MNLALYYDDLDPEVVAAADAKQKGEESACRARKESHAYANILCVQSEGPLRQFVIPDGHSRVSRFGKFQEMLKCKRACREVSFEALKGLLEGGTAGEDDMPLDILGATFR